MNISPTPRRYAPRTDAPRMNPLADDNRYHFVDPIGNNRFQKYNTNDDDILLPPEYKLSTQTFNELVALNKRLSNMLETKQREINELKAENNEFRSKLWKYTEMADRYKKELDRKNYEEKQRSLSENDAPQDYIQISKRRDRPNGSSFKTHNIDKTPERETNSSENQGNDAQTRKIETLIKNVEQINELLTQSSKRIPTPPPEIVSEEHQYKDKDAVSPTDNDILMSESSELRRLEDQIRDFQQRLNIKQQNEQRKISLQNRLMDLQDMLDSSYPLHEKKNRSNKKENIFYSTDDDATEVKPILKGKQDLKRVDRASVFRTPPGDI